MKTYVINLRISEERKCYMEKTLVPYKDFLMFILLMLLMEENSQTNNYLKYGIKRYI